MEKYIERNDIALGTMPFTHVSGLWLLSHALSVGATVVMVVSPGIKETLSAIEKHKASVLSFFTNNRRHGTYFSQ